MEVSFKELGSMIPKAEYSESGKAAWKAASMKMLRRLAKDLGLARSSYTIRFNPGGIAVSGEAILHHDNFYVMCGAQFNPELPVLFRTCRGQKDFCGGFSRYPPSYASLVEACREC